MAYHGTASAWTCSGWVITVFRWLQSFGKERFDNSDQFLCLLGQQGTPAATCPLPRMRVPLSPGLNYLVPTFNTHQPVTGERRVYHERLLRTSTGTNKKRGFSADALKSYSMISSRHFVIVWNQSPSWLVYMDRSQLIKWLQVPFNDFSLVSKRPPPTPPHSSPPPCSDLQSENHKGYTIHHHIMMPKE